MTRRSLALKALAEQRQPHELYHQANCFLKENKIKYNKLRNFFFAPSSSRLALFAAVRITFRAVSKVSLHAALALDPRTSSPTAVLLALASLRKEENYR